MSNPARLADEALERERIEELSKDRDELESLNEAKFYRIEELEGALREIGYLVNVLGGGLSGRPVVREMTKILNAALDSPGPGTTEPSGEEGEK